MFDHLVKANNLEPVMKQHGLTLPEDLVFIRELISGPLDKGASKDSQVPVAVHTWISMLLFCSQLVASLDLIARCS